MRCTACGTDNAPERRFCADCGAGLAIACGICNAANEARARFCGQCGASLDGPGVQKAPGLAEAEPRSWPAAERRQLTLLFCDLCSSTTLSDRLDPEDMREVLEGYRARCAAALARYGGTVAYYMGDGILAYFGYPTAHEDDALRAVRAALEIVPAVATLGAGWPWPLPLPLQVRIEYPYRPRRRRRDQPRQPPQRAVGGWPRPQHRSPAAESGRPGFDRGQRSHASPAARRVRDQLAGPPPAARNRRDHRGAADRERAAGRHRRHARRRRARRAAGQPGVGARDPGRVLGGGTARRRAGGAPLRRTWHRQVAAGRARSSPAYRRARIRYCCSSARPTSSTARCIR